MANKNLFQSIVGSLLPKTNSVNEESAPAYKFDDKHALAEFAATGCLNSTFYATDAEQLGKVLQMCEKVEPEFIARTALYARHKGFMKDMPALLTALLSIKGPGLLAEVFDRVIDSPKMLRNFVQIMRSGAVGRKSLGSLPKRMVTQWLTARTDEQAFNGSIGNDPSMADVIRMVDPRPGTPSREALYAYLIGRDYDAEKLPAIVQQFEQYKAAKNRAELAVPNVPFQMLTALDLGRASGPTSPQCVVADGSDEPEHVPAARRIRAGRTWPGSSPASWRIKRLIAKAKVFPYQLMVAYLFGGFGAAGHRTRGPAGRDGSRHPQRAGGSTARCTCSRTSPARCTRR